MTVNDPFPSAPPPARDASPPSLEDRPSSAPPPFRSSVPPNLMAGLRIGGKYELQRKLGTGAMGEVWAAKHLSLDEEVAIKVVMRDTTHEDGTTAESRFLLEARVAATLSRKTRHIVNVTDHGEDGPYAYLVMELLHGESLDVRINRTGPLPLSKAVPIVYQIARALAVAHADGIVHRDLKPSNVFVTVDEEGRSVVKILDFGIAKLRHSRRRISTTDAKHTTMRGFLLGTPAYMSPEQARAKKIDHRTDVWALAVIAYHLLTREYPFDGETPEDLFARLCRIEPIAIHDRRPDLPSVVGDFFARAFQPRIDDRFQTAVALSGAFEQLEPLARGLSVVSAMSAISAPPPSARVDEKTSTLRGIAAEAPAASEREPEEQAELGETTVDAPASVPPPPRRSSHPPPSAAAKEESSIFAAGVPSKKRRWAGYVAAAIVLGVLVGTGSLLNLHFERDVKGTGLVVNTAPPSTMTDRESIPPPPDPAAPAPVVNAADLPEVVTPPVAREASKNVVAPSQLVMPEPAPAPLAVTAPAASPATPSTAAPAPATKKPIDKGEIF